MFKNYEWDLLQNECLLTIDWIDVKSCEKMCKFAKILNDKYNINISLIFLFLAGVEFTAQYYMGNSCTIAETDFDRFEEFLLEKERELIKFVDNGK